jgi:hypothetical protein
LDGNRSGVFAVEGSETGQDNRSQAANHSSMIPAKNVRSVRQSLVAGSRFLVSLALLSLTLVFLLFSISAASAAPDQAESTIERDELA